MTSERRDLAETIHRWTNDASDRVDYGAIDDHIYYMEQKRFREYEPTQRPAPDFRTRLASSLENAPDERCEKALFRLVPELLFIGRGEFSGLYRLALNQSVCFWLMDVCGIRVSHETAETVSEACENTWFCPITDSMQIAAFYHVNNISGVDLRPTWRVLSEFATQENVVTFLERKGLRRIVLLEDFVGTGNQMQNAVEFAAELPGEWPVLVVPLVVCPEGRRRGRDLEARYEHLSFSPVLELPETVFVKKTHTPDELGLFEDVRHLVEATADRMEPSLEGFVGPYGYGDTGALVVMYTNCPNNTLPVIHHRSERWSPIFPRSSRV